MIKNKRYGILTILLMVGSQLETKSWHHTANRWTRKNPLQALGIAVVTVTGIGLLNRWFNGIPEDEVKKPWMRWYSTSLMDTLMAHSANNQMGIRALLGNSFEWPAAFWNENTIAIYEDFCQNPKLITEVNQEATQMWDRYKEKNEYSVIELILKKIRRNAFEREIRKIKRCKEQEKKQKLLEEYGTMFTDLKTFADEKLTNKSVGTKILVYSMLSAFAPATELIILMQSIQQEMQEDEKKRAENPVMPEVDDDDEFEDDDE